MLMTAACVVALAAAGCGGDGGEPGVATLAGGTGAATPTASASADPEDAFRRFAKCMREHGVDMPDPDGDSGMVVVAPDQAPPRQMAAADRACNHLLKGALRDGAPPDDPEMQDRALKFARCMRQHGVDLPDPGANGSIQKAVPGGTGGGGPAPFETEEFKRANKACAPLLGPGVQQVGP
jgi:hypothetical protein